MTCAEKLSEMKKYFEENDFKGCCRSMQMGKVMKCFDAKRLLDSLLLKLITDDMDNDKKYISCRNEAIVCQESAVLTMHKRIFNVYGCLRQERACNIDRITNQKNTNGCYKEIFELRRYVGLDPVFKI